MTTLSVNEIFHTIQGEGPYTGKPSVFIRLAGCNLRCYWCDTTYTWLYSLEMADAIRTKLPENLKNYPLEVYNKSSEVQRLSINSIIEQVERFNTSHVVISGGEPMLQKHELILVTNKLLGLGYAIEIETNGTISPEGLSTSIRLNVSPKLANSYNEKDKRYKPSVLDELIAGNSIFKFVIQNQEDLVEVENIITSHKIPNEKIYLMPEGKSSDELKAKSLWLINICKVRNYNYCHRLHIDLFDKMRGV